MAARTPKAAWIEKRAHRTYRVRYRQGGKIVTAETVHSVVAAERIRDRIDHTLQANAPTYAGQLLSLATIAERYAAARLAGGSINEGTAYSIRRLIPSLAEQRGWRTVADITPAELDKWWSEKAPGTTWRYLRTCLRWAAFRLDQPVDPRILQRAPTPHRQQRAEPELIPNAYVQRSLARAAAIMPEAELLIHWLATYGARPVTLAHMRTADIDTTAGSAYLRHIKSKTLCTHPLKPRTLTLIEQCQRGEYLFIDPRTGSHWRIGPSGSATSISQWYTQHIAHDYPQQWRGIYVLKDWAITRMVDAGIADKDIIRYTGHKTTTVLARYKKSSLDAARAVLDKLPDV